MASALLLIMLTTFLGMLAILSSWSAIKMRTKEYYILLLLFKPGMLGVFMALDFFLFYVFLGSHAGSDVLPDRRLGKRPKTLRRYQVLHVHPGWLRDHAPCILALYFNYAKTLPSGASAHLISPHFLPPRRHFPDSLKVWLFWGFFFAFAIKVPMFPFHTWLPDAHTEAPTAGSVILAGVLLKMGTYGFLRFSLPLLPADPVMRAKIIHIVVVLSIIGIIYGAVVCLMQKDMKRLIAYSSVSHLGFCTLGIFALTPLGLSGSVLQQINHGISTGALFLIVGVLYERRHTRLISEFGGLATPMPTFAAIYLIISLSSLGMPLLNGFIGEVTILQGTFVVSKAWAAWASLGIVLGAAYLLWLYQRTMFGAVTHDVNKTLPDMNLREHAVLIPLVVMAFWIGIYPKPFFAFIEKPVDEDREASESGLLSCGPGAIGGGACDFHCRRRSSKEPRCTSPFSIPSSITSTGMGLVILPQMELLLFALGILIFDFLLEKKEKEWNAILAFLGVVGGRSRTVHAVPEILRPAS